MLFEVPFTSAMTDSDLAVLRRLLDLSTHMHKKLPADPNGPGVRRLDHFSGLFLKRGAREGRWVLEARTWGDPAPGRVHEWHLLAALAARQLDPTVNPPERLEPHRPELSQRPVGPTENRRIARVRRHVAGLP